MGRFRGFSDILPTVFVYGDMVLFLVKYSVGVFGAKNNDAHAWVHLPFRKVLILGHLR